MIAEVQEYFDKGCGRCARFATADCATRLWAAPLAALRDLCRGAGLDEVVKWGHPCYTHAGRNVALIGATRAGVRLSFFEAGLLSDPLLQPCGPNSAPDTVFLADTAEVAALAPDILALLAAARAHAAAGRRAPRRAADLTLPDELSAALDDDPDLAAAFAALTPGRQRSHVIALTSTASPATRLARIARLRGRIMSGKGATER
jgi:uncharacterized protein YdeI (YjbR/CyaY-like superfamily)